MKKEERVIGLNTGAGNGFVNKAWTVKGYVQLIVGLKKKSNDCLLLLGGPNERERNQQIIRQVGGWAIDTGCDNTLGQFAALVNLCDVVVSGDTAALHIAIALKKKVVAIYGLSQPQETELYGRGEKIITSLSCAPCCRRSCEITPNCMDVIKAEEVIKAVQRLL